MRTNDLKAILRTGVRGAAVLLLGAGVASAQQTINLTAQPGSAILPDGSSVPMWGYACGAAASASTTATCTALSNAGGWSPVVITVPTGQGLTINLTNSLPAPVPTSLVIVGQLGGGLGDTTQIKTAPSPTHDNQGTTWPIANSGAVFTPPAQGARVQSFATEVANGATGTLTWSSLNPGTYLIESGTHPSIQGPMGLYGMLVVTSAPSSGTAGTAYPNVSYSADVPLLMSEIDPAQNKAVAAAVSTSGFVETATYGPITSGPVMSINLIGGGSNYTSAPTVSFTGGGGSGATATALVDTTAGSPTYGMVTEIDIANGGNYETAPQVVISGGGGSGASATAALQLNPNALAHCTGGATACYPPVVNYTPLYYLFNGVAFNKTNAAGSVFATTPGMGVSGNVLVRFVNAGLRMHVPSIVGSTTGTTPAGGFSLIAEDGNPLPGIPRVQSEVFMAAGKTYDVMINAPASGTVLPVFDRQLSLSGNSISRDAGMLAYVNVNGGSLPTGAGGTGAAVANPDTYNSVLVCAAAPCQTLSVSDPSKGVIANDINVYGVKVLNQPAMGTLVLASNGTFTYTPNGPWPKGTTDSFTYQANGNGPTATVTLNTATMEDASGITLVNDAYTSTLSRTLSIKSPGILANDADAAGYPLSVVTSSISAQSGLTVSVNQYGGFDASLANPCGNPACIYTFTYKVQNSQGTMSASSATVTLTFPQKNGPTIQLLDGSTRQALTVDYRWVVEEDRTFYVDPTKATNTSATGGTTQSSFGTNFHTSYMPLIAEGCTVTGSVSCGAGQTVLGAAAPTQTAADPSELHLDTTKRYYISVLPGDAANPFDAGNVSSCLPSTDPKYDPTQCGHGMGGASIYYNGSTWVANTAPTANNVPILVEPTPLPPAKLTVFVFEDDFPLNGEQDASGGLDVLAPNEPGLGGFSITIFDDAGGTGDATGQVDYDMFNQPLSNSLAGTVDPATGNDACPISPNMGSRTGTLPNGQPDITQTGIAGMIVTCPKYESDGKTLSPLAGQAVVANMMPGRYGIVATPGADRIGRGEEWLQTNTLDGQKAHDSFLKVGEPAFFQEYGPASFHVTIGFANPAIINSRLKGVCNGTDVNITGTNCSNSITGTVTTERMSRTPDERLYSSGSNDSFSFTQCYVSFGDPDGEDFAFTKCASDGTFKLSGLPDGDWRVTVFDQWNDMLVDGLSTPVRLAGGKQVNMGDIATTQWQANIYTRTFFDQNGDGVSNTDGNGNPTEPGLTLVPTNIRFRDGSYSNFNNTDLNGNAGFNEVFPLFNWYTIETDDTRYKNTGTHVVYDAGGPADGSPACSQSGNPKCASSSIGSLMARTYEDLPVPGNLHVPGAVYCNNADCTGQSIQNGPNSASTPNSTGRIDPPWVKSEGWQGFSGQNSFLEFGKKPFNAGENGGIHGHVVYASTRPFDDPQLLLQTSWEPLVPGVTINLYKEGTAPDGSKSLSLVDTTTTSSWDDWAQGFRADGVPNMNCPGQGTASGTDADVFFFSLYNQPMYLDAYNNGGTAQHTLPNNSQYKCYDGMHNWNQLQPAPYDGRYEFPSIIARDPVSGKPTGSFSGAGAPGSVAGTNCTICVANTAADKSDFNYGEPMLPDGTYVVEVVVPPGYELVKEEDKNILIGDNFIAPVTVQFPGLGGSVFILPDQAEVGSAYNSNNAQNPTNSLGRNSGLPSHEGDTGSIETYWPCVGEPHLVPDFISLYPQSQEVAPFAGATRPLCDRKEVTLDDQTSALAKFYVFTSTHVAAHFTGVITDDFTAEFDPFSPQFGEKFAPPDLPVSVKDWNGNEVGRVYADHFGYYDGLNYSTWEVNPPNPTGYSPTMMVMCMNDPGTGATPDVLFNPGYSQFCYELPFMPGQTQYMDTPVTPTSAFSEGYNHPDCAYPDATPAISEVDGDGVGPWVSTTGARKLTITALGDQQVMNNAYSGPSATTSPYNQKTVKRHYGFGTTKGTVAIGGYSIPVGNITTWTDTSIVLTIPANATIPACLGPAQQTVYGGTAAKCGQLVITAANGKQSVDTVTVTVGGKAPTRIASGQTIQSAIDAAKPGDLIIVPSGAYNEMVIMWKPVRLQGVGAAATVINANTQPAGKLDPWRQKLVCLFGLSLNGQPRTATGGSNPYDPTGTVSCGGWTGFDTVHPQVDRLPLEGILGWDTTVNGNLAQLLQEPTLMGAYEGAGITVLGKGIKLPAGVNPFSAAAFGTGNESAFPAGTTLLSSRDCLSGNSNPYPSNFYCNPSSIDGISVTNSSQGGGGIFLHAWAHNLQIANNRVYNNTGTLTGGITVGQGESPDAYLQGDAGNADPGSCESAILPGKQLPYCFDYKVNVHHNYITDNSSIGDELYSSTPAGGGGVTICTGADYYQFQYNWVCGNLSSGDGGGLVHLGFIKNGDIEHNTVLFNQSTNPTVPTNGGGILAMGAPPDGLTATGAECGGTVADADCAPGLSDGTGPGLVINANLVMGNSAESGSGGGIRLQNVNGTEVTAFPLVPGNWNDVTLTNNIIADNVAGWDGGGISLVDALNVNIINNTIMSNDTTASAGVLFNTIGAPISSTDPVSQPGQVTSTTTSAPQPAGLVSIQNSAVLAGAIKALPSVLGVKILCPAYHSSGGVTGLPVPNGTCMNTSYPLIYNDVFWQNRAFYIGVGSLGSGTLNQQNVVALYNAFAGGQVASQPSTDAQTNLGNGKIITGGTGACFPGTNNFWDIGVRGDTGPTDHSSTVTLNPVYSFVTSGYTGSNNSNTNPTVVSQYCNGSRTPPEYAQGTWQVPPGISDATVPNPLFNLQPNATVDEGNNWINISWGPLTMFNPVNGGMLGNYSLGGGSPAINYIPNTAAVAYGLAPATDFFGNQRKTDNHVDAGAVEFQPPAGVNVLPTTLTFPNTVAGTSSAAQPLTLYNNTATALTGISVTITGSFSRATVAQGGAGTCVGALAAGANCTINIVFNAPASPATGGSYTGNATLAGNATINGSPVALSGTAVPAARTLTITPTSLAFGSWFAGSASGAQTLTVTNTGNVPTTTGIAVGFGGGTPQPYSRPAGAAGGTCTAAGTLAVGASCTVNVIFTAPAAGTYSRTLTVTSTGETVTPNPVNLTGTSTGTRAAVSISPNPLVITLPSGAANLTGTGIVTLTNAAPAGGASTLVTAVNVTGGNLLSYTFNAVAGQDNCTGTTLAPGASCTVGVRFTNIISLRGPTRTGSITFTDSATGSPQAGVLQGVATP